jgi:homeobox protein YOX1/YHP1
MNPSLRLLLQAAGGASPTSTSPVANASGSSPTRASTLPAIAPRPQASLLPSVDVGGATGLPDGQDSNAMAPAETSQQRVSAAVHSLHALTAPRTSPAVAYKPSTAAGAPLIAKRRRRTSPAELAILEIEFRCNPLPSQSQRNDIAAKVGMTGRAAQVWFQNRR